MSDSISTHPAYCGFNCAECPVFIATVSGDASAMDSLRKKFSTPEHVLSDEELSCHGCKSKIPSGHAFCSSCEFRTCAMPRGIDSCGQCTEYPCSSIEKRFPSGCVSRKILDEEHDRFIK